jgi:hypothetical protein
MLGLRQTQSLVIFHNRQLKEAVCISVDFGPGCKDIGCDVLEITISLLSIKLYTYLWGKTRWNCLFGYIKLARLKCL